MSNRFFQDHTSGAEVITDTAKDLDVISSTALALAKAGGKNAQDLSKAAILISDLRDKFSKTQKTMKENDDQEQAQTLINALTGK